MLKEFAENATVYLVTGKTDMRKGIDGLSEMVSGVLNLDPYSGALFLFCGGNKRKLKALLFEGDGYILCSKRLSGEGRFRWPKNDNEARKLTQQQIRWLLEGLEIEQRNAISQGQKCDLF